MKRIFSLVNYAFFSPTARNMYWALLGNGIYAIFTFVFFVLIAPKKLGPEEFGRLSALFAFILLLADLTDAGLGASLSRFLPPLLQENNKQKALRFTKAVFVFQMIVSLILGLIVFFSASLLSKYLFDYTSAVIVRLTSFSIMAIVLFGFANFLYSARQKFNLVTMIASVVSGTRVGGALILLAIGKFNLVTALLLLVLPGFLSLIPLILSSDSFFSASVTKKDWVELFSFSKYLGINKVFTAIASRTDVLLLSALLGSFEVGVYSAAVRITQIYQLVLGSLSTVFAPRFAIYHSISEARKFTQKVMIVTMIILISVVFLFIVAHPFIASLFGEQYIRSIPVFQALLIPSALFVLQLPFNGLLLYTLKKPHIFLIISVTQLTITLAGTIFFIPLLGIFGPVVGLGLGYGSALAIMIGSLWYFWRKEK